MNDSKLEIKEQRKGFFAKGITLLLFIIASLLVAFIPLLYSEAKKHAVFFYIIGGICFAAFTFLFSFMLYKECNPNNVLILNSRGFTATKHIGHDIEIEWTNVSAVKILGKKETPFLGISLENPDIVIAKMGKKQADEMRENIEENLPHILISQNEIRTSVKEIKDLFVKFVRESRVLENEIPKQSKSNPFSTEDVLRAFGKLPQDKDSEPETPTQRDNKIIYDDKSKIIKELPDISQTEPKEETKEVLLKHEFIEEQNESEHAANETATLGNNNDSFYSSLKQKLDLHDNIINEEEIIGSKTVGLIQTADDEPSEEKIETFSNKESINDEMPEELLAILSRAKSSKIDELGKILNDPSPISFSQDYSSKKNADNEPIFDITDNEPNDTVFGSLLDEDMLDMSSTSEEQSTKTSESNNFKIILPNELYNDSNVEEDTEVTFESLLNLKNSETHSEQNTSNDVHDDKTDTKEFYPDLLKFNLYKNTNMSSADNKNDNEDDLIIPDLSEYNS